jgi:hypothetical protein
LQKYYFCDYNFGGLIVISIWEGGRFHNVFGDRPTKWPVAKENKK